MRRPEGFTLLEMLAVVAIMAAMAYVALDSLTDDNGQRRFVETRIRLETLRRAIVGTPERTVNGQPQISGFVADVGRLPRCLEELMDREADCDGDGDVDSRAAPEAIYNSDARTFVGWNGPYLPVLRETSLGLLFRDGWGNSPIGTSTDFGWVWAFQPIDVATGNRDAAAIDGVVQGALRIQSRGMDGRQDCTTGAGTGTYEADYPPDPDGCANPTLLPDNLVEQADHQVDVANWGVAVTFRNIHTAQVITNFCLRLYYPRDGAVPVSPNANVMSGPQSLTVNEGEEATLTLTFTNATPLLAPWGQRTFELAEGTPCASATAIGTKPVQLIPRAAPTAPDLIAVWNGAVWTFLP